MVFLVDDIRQGKELVIKKCPMTPPVTRRPKEVKILESLNHPNILILNSSYYNLEPKNPKLMFLNLVTPLMDCDLSKLIRTFRYQCTPFPPALLKLYAYQMIKSLAYLECVGVVHRDIRPQNFLVDLHTHRVVLGDFGSATVAERSPIDESISFRYYKAPELLLGSGNHTAKSDIWALGCTIAELSKLRIVFAGDSDEQQPAKLFQVLGLPSKNELAKLFGVQDDRKRGSVFRSFGLKEVGLKTKLSICKKGMTSLSTYCQKCSSSIQRRE